MLPWDVADDSARLCDPCTSLGWLRLPNIREFRSRKAQCFPSVQLSHGNAHTSHYIQRATGKAWLSCERDGHVHLSFLRALRAIPAAMGFCASEVA